MYAWETARIGFYPHVYGSCYSFKPRDALYVQKERRKRLEVKRLERR